ncbi:hypothetical protein [Nisaea acidiphila]|uniref:hypothetical protein n=1 Tax=Nisaea acidiphila TaxID=1862145 RepID=UPI003566CD45
MFNNELDILELRLRELENVVDTFVLVEAAQTHTGLPKPLHFAENRERFTPWLDRIRYIGIKEFPSGLKPWGRENAQRRAISLGLKDLKNDDLVIISDVDEIPRASSIEETLTRKDVDVIGLQLTHFHLRLNYLQLEGRDPIFVWPVAAWGSAFKQSHPQKLRDFRITLKKKQATNRLDDNLAVLNHAGWHFSYIGDDDHVRQKLASFAHTEHAVSEVIETLGVEEAIRRGMDTLGRPGFRWKSVAINEYFPDFVRRSRDRFTHLIAPDPTHEINPDLVVDTPAMVLAPIRGTGSRGG